MGEAPPGLPELPGEQRLGGGACRPGPRSSEMSVGLMSARTHVTHWEVAGDVVKTSNEVLQFQFLSFLVEKS